MKKINTYSAAAVAALWLALTIFLWFGSRTDVSEAERRKLESFPTLSMETVLDGRFMRKFETFTQDQFPVRDAFRSLKARFSYDVLHRLDNNGIYIADGYAAKLEYPLNESSVMGAMAKFQKMNDTWLQNCGKVLFCVVPDKGYYLAEQHGYPSMDYTRLFELVQAQDWAEYVDLTDCLSAESYYRTDTHWRQEKLLPAAEKIAAALGVEIGDAYTVTALERPFYGVYYGQAALPMEPEIMYCMESETIAGCTVTNYETGKASAVYDPTKLNSRDLYDVFLSGAVSLLTIENPAADSSRELLIFRDSFGSSLAPLLIPGYHKITLIDIRYLPADMLAQYIEISNQDVLFLYSPLVLNHSTMLKG